MTSHSLPQLLSLRDIAAWQFPQLAQNMANQRPPIVAAIPSLQRGAVWKPQQVELLWDSILRGFPIGALVVYWKGRNRAQANMAQAGRMSTSATTCSTASNAVMPSLWAFSTRFPLPTAIQN